MYEDGKPGEIFLVMAKEGSTISGLMDAFATSISMALQYGVPLEALVEKFSHVRFEPSGFTKNPEIPYAKTITDYIFRWLAVEVPLRRARRRRPACSAREPSAPAGPQCRRPNDRPGGGECRGRGARPVGRTPVPLLREHHDPQRGLLPLRQLRQHERL